MKTDLTLYKRHNCGLTDKSVFDCQCPIWITGRLPDGQLVPRQSTGYTDRDGAEAIRLDLIRRFTKETAHRGKTIQAALDEFLALHRDDLSEDVVDHYLLWIGRLIHFCDERKIHYMPQLTVDLVDSFNSIRLAGLASTTRASGMGKVRTFLKDSFRRGWISEPLADRMKRVIAIYEEKSPYTDEEVQSILDGCGKLKVRCNGHGYSSQPDTFRLLLELMLETGMRAGDAARFDPAKVVPSDKLFMYRFLMQKRRKTKALRYHDVYITERLRNDIERCTWLSSKLPFAWGSFTSSTYLANEIYHRMQYIGKAVGVNDCRPHRLRDTFAVRCLLRGLTLDDVSRALGHSSVQTTEKYYARWVPARSRLLESKLAAVLT